MVINFKTNSINLGSMSLFVTERMKMALVNE